MNKTINSFTPLLFGALLAFAFAPVSLPGLAIISLAWFFCTIAIQENPHKTHTTQKKHRIFSRTFFKGWLYGIGFFTAGTSWIYISIRTYGHTDFLLASFITLLFILLMGFYIACFSGCFALLFSRKNNHSTEINAKNIFIKSIGFSALWVLFEYIRANLFTGFPWLLLGYSQIDTPMQYLAPIIGVYGLSFLVALSGCFLTIAWIYLKESKKANKKKAYYFLIIMLLLYLFPQSLSSIHWTKPVSSSYSHTSLVSVSIVQGNISEEEKWVPGAYQKTLQHYIALTKTILPETKIIIWPEGAIPVPYPQAQFFLQQLSNFIQKNHATLVAGIPYADQDNLDEYYNAMIVLGNNQSINQNQGNHFNHYFKHHLVPFGEYIPSTIFRDWMKAWDIALYETRRGTIKQPLLMIEGIPTLPFICYEIGYSDILVNALPQAQLLMTISDDAWFGHSMARAQHLQIARMRSLQSGRYQIFATNNGISAIIDSSGTITNELPSFKSAVLNGFIQPMIGKTPWANMGDTAIMIILSGILIAVLFLQWFILKRRF